MTNRKQAMCVLSEYEMILFRFTPLHVNNLPLPKYRDQITNIVNFEIVNTYLILNILYLLGLLLVAEWIYSAEERHRHDGSTIFIPISRQLTTRYYRCSRHDECTAKDLFPSRFLVMKPVLD